MVEFALVAPILLMMLLLMIDFGRLAYTYSAISWAAREGARMATLSASQSSDCAILRRVEDVGRGFPLTPDAGSIAPNNDPNNAASGNNPTPASSIPAGVGYVYIWPAVATRAPIDGNCNGQPRNVTGSSSTVAVQIQYRYQPLIPLFSEFIPNITLNTISVVRTEY